ncbi:MAG: hypothetical protein ACRCYU_23540 [Nocardioides sp.]
MTTSRVTAGTPDGGQFAATPRQEAGINLTAELPEVQRQHLRDLAPRRLAERNIITLDKDQGPADLVVREGDDLVFYTVSSPPAGPASLTGGRADKLTDTAREWLARTGVKPVRVRVAILHPEIGFEDCRYVRPNS